MCILNSSTYQMSFANIFPQCVLCLLISTVSFAEHRFSVSWSICLVFSLKSLWDGVSTSAWKELGSSHSTLKTCEKLNSLKNRLFWGM